MIIACKNCIYLEECQKKNQPFDTDTECLTAESKKTYNKGYQQGRADGRADIINVIKVLLCTHDEDYDKPIISPKFLADYLDQIKFDGVESEETE